jgi:hypothetical protein
VILEVERQGVPIRGSLSIAPGVERRFHGWLDLADALEAARGGSDGSATELEAAERPAVLRIS